jgi:hypothetical protein
MIPPLSSRIENETNWTQEQKRKAKEELDKYFQEAEEAIEEMERESERRKREGAPYLDAWKKAAKEYDAAEKRAQACEKALEDCVKRPAEGRPDGAGMNRNRCAKEAEENDQAIKALGDAWNALSRAMEEYIKRFPTP